MRPSRNFVNITLADFIVRAAYQMGKTPLLPFLAASLGASDVLLGSIVSISTLTGMVMKPLFGVLSDRQGRRWWLILGTLFFAGIPFLYRFVTTPGQLVLIRMVHGTATAIYGPVTVAFVAERAGLRKAESLGWFGIARSGGYIVGPAVAGWLLLTMQPTAVFTVVGLISCTAFIPVLGIEEEPNPAAPGKTEPTLGDQEADDEYRTAGHAAPARMASIMHDLRCTLRGSLRGLVAALRAGSRTPAVWLSGGMEATVYVATYAIKAFLPIYALAVGYNTAQVGLFFSVQEALHLLLRPLGGRMGDRLGYLRAVALGLVALAISLPALTQASSFPILLALAAATGAAQALIFPATLALVSEQIEPDHLGAGMGLVGTLNNAGKVAGPIVGGFLIAGLGYDGMFWLMGLLTLLGALILQLSSRRNRSSEQPAIASLQE